MRVILDFALTESRAQLDKVLVELRKQVEFELHDALAAFENKYSEENGGKDVAILDVDAMVKNLIEQMEDKLRAVLDRPQVFRVNEAPDEIETVLVAAFDMASNVVANIHVTDMNELYVAIIEKGGTTLINDTVTWTDVLEDTVIGKINDVYKPAQKTVVDICRKEIAYLGEKYGKVAG